MNILIIDSHNMIHRVRHGFGQGEHIMTFGFFRALKSEITKHNADKVYVVNEGHPKHRYVLNPDYKGTRVRERDDGFTRQKDDIFDLCKYLPITYIRHKDYECDDVIGYLSKLAKPEDSVTIISTDTDFIQLLTQENVKLWNPVKKKYIEKWPCDYVGWKSLVGDKSDNVSGIRGIGTQRAFKIMESNETLSKFLNSDEKKKEVFNNCYEQIQLAELSKFIPGWEIESYNFDEVTIKKEFNLRGFKSITGNTWYKFKSTMEKLNNGTNKYNTNEPAAG